MKLARPLIVALLTFAVVLSVPVAATNGIATRPQQQTVATAAAQDPAAVEASLGLGRPARRLIQRGLRNEGFDPGTPDGLFGPRTRTAIRRWQEVRGTSATGYLDDTAAQLLRAAGAPPGPSSPITVPGSTPNESSVTAPPPRSSTPAAAPLASVARAPGTTPAEEQQTAAPAAGTAQLPPEIMVDRHLVRADRLLAADDPGAALEAMNEVLALQEEHDLELANDFYFQYARVAFAAGRTAIAITSLNEYLIAAGRGGEFYREALELLDSADVRFAREEAERDRAEVEHRRATRWPPGEVFRDCEACPEMVVLPGSVLALGRYEVTLGEYRAFASATGGGAGGGCFAIGDGDYSWRNPNFQQTDRHPVTCVSLDDAQAYLSWLSRTSGVAYRLPTWAELVRAAEGSQPGCHRDRTGRDGACPVGTYRSSRLGLSDMLGNVWEWASDCWEGDCGRRPAHGGGWANPTRFLIPNWFGSPSRPDSRSNVTGFRVARTLD